MADSSDSNFYDDLAKVEAYLEDRQAGRSRNQLVEEPGFLSLLASVPVQDQPCLDLGCGFGHYSLMLAERGGYVTAIDRSALMIAAARKYSAHERIHYQQMAMEDATFPDATFGVVISNLALHYLADLAAMIGKVYRWLRPGGSFVLTVEHPIFTATRNAPLATWHDGEAHTEWIITNYFSTGPRQGPFGLHYHHTLQEYVATLQAAGFLLQEIVEPQPSADALRLNPNLAQDLHRPVFIGFRCLKPGQG